MKYTYRWDESVEDTDLFEHEWQYLVENLTDDIKRINPCGYWKAIGHNMGWMNRTGWKEFKATDGQSFLDGVPVKLGQVVKGLRLNI